MVGERIGSYAIKRVIGEGGMGFVYEAVQEPIGRRVAIKVLHSEFAHKEDVIKRFFNEARAVNLITHPSIVQISDYGVIADGTAYLVMELLEGQTLDAHIKSTGGRLPEPLAQNLAWQLASAMEAAHQKEIIHRDLKPSNVMIIADSAMPFGLRVKLLDFGIAKLGQSLEQAQLKTRTGLVMGTPLYMAPEQCLGTVAITPKADVYALGILLFEMLTGAPPFYSDSDLVVLNQHVKDKAPTVQSVVATISRGTSELVAKMLEKEPALRPSMTEAAHRLQLLGTALSSDHDTLMVSKHIGAVSSSVQRQKVTGTDSADGSRKNPAANVPAFWKSGISKKDKRQANLFFIGIISGLFLIGSLLSILLYSSFSNRNANSGQVVGQNPSNSPTDSKDTPIYGVNIDIAIDSEPSGATVVDADTETTKGVTPWKQSSVSRDADDWIILRKEGYRDRLLRISLRRSLDRKEFLSPDPIFQKPSSPQRQKKAATERRRPSRQVLQDWKVKLQATPGQEGRADLPAEPYRLVD